MKTGKLYHVKRDKHPPIKIIFGCYECQWTRDATEWDEGHACKLGYKHSIKTGHKTWQQKTYLTDYSVKLNENHPDYEKQLSIQERASNELNTIG